MLTIEIPDFATLRLEHLVLDYNGTLAEDGAILEGVRERLERLSAALRIHVVTGDTFGSARASLEGLPCELAILASTGQSQAKLDYVRRLSAASVACIGNGRNDRLMMQACALGIAVIQARGRERADAGRGRRRRPERSVMPSTCCSSRAGWWRPCGADGGDSPARRSSGLALDDRELGGNAGVEHAKLRGPHDLQSASQPRRRSR